jgi:hypothetical protein
VNYRANNKNNNNFESHTQKFYSRIPSETEKISNEQMNNHTHTQYTSVLRGTHKWEKTTECFFLCVLKNYIHWKHQLPFFFQLQLEGDSNPLFYQATT